MPRNIKNLRPDPRGKYEQGYINPNCCRRLYPSLKGQPIIYRSSYEKKFMEWLETADGVRWWGSECMRIPYRDLEGRVHSYFPDYLVEFEDGRRMVVEIKPLSQTQRPINESSWVAKEWKKNMLKWNAALQFCKANGLEFKVLTEKTIERL